MKEKILLRVTNDDALLMASGGGFCKAVTTPPEFYVFSFFHISTPDAFILNGEKK